MKVVILAGGLGTRLAEETEVRPKPMIEIGGRPILWHIMKRYAHFGHTNFAIALGYKGHLIKRFFMEYANLNGDLTISLRQRRVERINDPHEDWTVGLYDTGVNTMTGGRLRRLAAILRDGAFMMTYGDGVGDIDLDALLRFHRSHGRLATLTAVRPPSRFGALECDGDQVRCFTEKPQVGEGWINGGFFVLEPPVLDYISDDSTHWEREPLERLAGEGQLMAFKHDGFWQCMDTLRDKRSLDELWERNQAPWMVW